MKSHTLYFGYTFILELYLLVYTFASASLLLVSFYTYRFILS
ncbi:hypothetical protein [Pontibacter mucosus]|nr:hypothetical protein [Pontibacter mucosus]